MNMQELASVVMVEAAKGAPPGVVAIKSQMDNWAAANVITALTVIYLALQIAWLIWQWRQASKKAKREAADQP